MDELITLREQCIEVAYTWQIPYKYLTLCERELKHFIDELSEDQVDERKRIAFNTAHVPRTDYLRRRGVPKPLFLQGWSTSIQAKHREKGAI